MRHKKKVIDRRKRIDTSVWNNPKTEIQKKKKKEQRFIYYTKTRWECRRQEHSFILYAYVCYIKLVVKQERLFHVHILNFVIVLNVEEE